MKQNQLNCNNSAPILKLCLAMLCIAMMMYSDSALAFGTTMPWETGLQAFAHSLCGTTARAVGVLAFAIAGISIALFEVKGWIHTIMVVLIGISIAILAPSILTLVSYTSSGISC